MLALAVAALAEVFRGQEAVATFDVEAEPPADYLLRPLFGEAVGSEVALVKDAAL
jgi:hypothetical protein